MFGSNLSFLGSLSLNSDTIPSPVLNEESLSLVVTNLAGAVIIISTGGPPSIVVFFVFLMNYLLVFYFHNIKF